jgi:hypothetical protein
MKKTLPLLIFLFGILPFMANAQSDDNSGLSEGVGPYIGLVGAINNTWIIIDNELQNNEHHEHQPTFGPAGGLVLGYKFNDKHSVQVEGFFSKQGAKYDILDDNGKEVGNKEIDLKYIAVPLLFKVSGVGSTRFNLHFGPQVAFLLSGEEVNTFTENVTVTKTFSGAPRSVNRGTYTIASDDSDDQKRFGAYKLNKVDPSVVLGLGVEHDISDQWYLSANLRFSYSFSDIVDSEVVDSPYNLDKYTLRYNVVGGLQIGIHYFFNQP